MKKITAILSAVSLAAALTVNSFAANLGDVNGDGSVNSQDALMVLQYSVGFKDKKFIKSNADLNGDGQINSADALKILLISVGAEKPSASVSNALKAYNDALKKTYSQLKKAKITNDFVCDYTLNGASASVKSNPQTNEFTFVNGLYNNELPASACGPRAELTEAMLQSADISESGKGYKIKLVLKPEKVDVKDEPIYNKAGGLTIDFTAEDLLISEYNSGYTTYSGTVIEAVTDSSGRITSLKLTAPYEGEYKLKTGGMNSRLKEKGASYYSASFSF